MLHGAYAHISVQDTSIRSMTPFIIRQQDPNVQHCSEATRTICVHSNRVHRHKISQAARSPPATLHRGMLQKHNSERGQRTRMWVVEFDINGEAAQFF